MWRKTRNVNVGSPCLGTGIMKWNWNVQIFTQVIKRSSNFLNDEDMNRNFGFHWDEGGSGDRSCQYNFNGDFPFSAIESQIVRDAIFSVANQSVVYLTFHSYGQYWLTPWGYTADYPEDYAQLVWTIKKIYLQKRNLGAYSHKLNNPNCSMTWLFVLLTNSPLSMEQSTPLVPRPTCSVSYFIVYNWNWKFIVYNEISVLRQFSSIFPNKIRRRFRRQWRLGQGRSWNPLCLHRWTARHWNFCFRVARRVSYTSLKFYWMY